MHDDSDASAFKQPSVKAQNLAKAIRRARGDMGQIQFAAVIGRVQSVVSQWENGKATPSIEALAIIEERLALPLGTLAAEAGFYSPEAARVGSAAVVRRDATRLTEALQLVRAAADLGFGVRMRSVHHEGSIGPRWLVEVTTIDTPDQPTSIAAEPSEPIN